jgi:hypothetical protein
MELLLKLSAIVVRMLRWLWTPFLCFILFCQLNHGRFWWQELVCSFTLYWAPVVGVGLVVTLYRYKRNRRGLPLLLVMSTLHLSVLFIVVSLARPHVYFGKWPSMVGKHVSQVGVLVAPFFDSETASARLDVLIHEYQPDVVVMMSNGNAVQRTKESRMFPFVQEHTAQRGGGIAILSKFPFRETKRDGVGFGALPAMYEQLSLPDGSTLEFGALLLSPITNQSAFEDNKVTARRIVTLVRNSSRHRIVVGSFFGSPFSKIVSLYTRQGRLRSVMFGRGFRNTWDVQNPFLKLPADHAFVSRYIEVQDVRLLDVPTAHHRGIFFRAIFEPRP